MTGALIEIDQADLRRFQRQLDRLIDARPRQALEQMAGAVEGQTRDRIQHKKAGPEGQAWDAWSDSYAATRIDKPGKSLLQNEGDLLDSITTGEITDDGAEVGTNLIYAATHQFGDTERNIPARPYLGLSRANVDDLERLLQNWVEAVLRG